MNVYAADPRLGLPADILGGAIDLLLRLTAQTSSSDDEPGLRRMADLLATELQARGFHVTLRDEPDEGGRLLPVIDALNRPAGRAGEPGDAARLLLIGHFDTVLPAAASRVEPDRIVATGAIDMKGGIVAFLKGVDLVDLRGGELPALRLILVPDEEVGGAISRRAVERAGAFARALWVLEPGDLSGAGETVVTGRRGMFHWSLDVDGTAAHSGVSFWDGRSAAAAAADWAQQTAALSRRDGGPTVNVARIVAGERAFVDDLAHGAALLGTAHRRNVVADRAVVEGEARFLRAGEDEGLQRALTELARDVAAAHGVEMRFAREASIPPVDPTLVRDGGSRELPADLATRLAAEAGWTLTREAERGGISFPNFLADPARIPVLDGLGPVGGGMHTREEFIALESLARRIRLVADLLQAEARLGG
ncbi:MAG: M20/M25/M40 family metallo-hydrolase [Thermoanaerobaculia bacterium]